MPALLRSACAALLIAACGGEPPLRAAAAPGEAQGLSFELDFLDAAQDEPERWEARLVERNGRGSFRTWSWQVLQPGPWPRLVYPRTEHEPDSDFAAQVELRLRERDWFARAPVSSTRGDRSGPVRLELVQYAGFGGVLLDVEGQAVADAQLWLWQATGSEVPLLYDGLRAAWSDEQGRFQYSARLEPGSYHLRVLSEGRADVQLDVELESGEIEGYELRLAGVEATEQLAVAIVGGDPSAPPEVIVSLRSLDDNAVRRTLHTRQEATRQGFVEVVGSGCAMLFAELPAGRYEVAAFGVDGWRYAPALVEIELPFDAEGLSLVTLGAAPRELHLRVRDERGEPLARPWLRLAGERWWFPEASLVRDGESSGRIAAGAAADRWMVFAEGYRPAHGSLAEPGDEPVEAVLRPGWGCELLLRDASAGLPRPDLDSWQQAAWIFQAQPLGGVTVLADGVPIGRSDATGRVRLALDAAPRRLEFDKPGWRVLDARAAGGEGGGEAAALARAGAAVLWFRPAE